MADIAKVKSNIAKMVSQGAPEEDIDGYIAANGLTVDDIRNFKMEQSVASAPEKQEGFQEANRRRAMEFAKGIPQGLGNAVVGGVQAATDLGESSARAIEKILYGDNMVDANSNSNFGGRLAGEVKKLKENQSKLPTSEKAGIFAGEIAPYLTSGATAGSKVAAKTGSKILGSIVGGGIGGGEMSLLSPQGEAGLDNRIVEGGKGAAASAATAGILGVGAKAIEPAINLAKPAISQFFAKATPIKSVREDLAYKQALGKLKKGIQKEGADAGQLLDEVEKDGVDLIDKVDPRFRIANEATKSLNRRGAIQIADQSLARVSDNVDKIQNSVLDMISTNKITPEKAGEILGRNSQKILDQALQARRAKAAPLYKKGLSSGTKIPLDSKLGPSSPEAQDLLGVDANDMTLGTLLKSPVIQNAISGARKKSAEFANSPADEIYGKIYEKSKPVYEIKKDPMGVLPEERTLKSPEQYKIPDNDVRVLNAVDNILYDKINEIKLTGANKEQTALGIVRNQISKLLDNANPDLKKARKYWKADTADIKAEGGSLVGKYAKLYKEGKIDELTKSAMDVLKLPVNRIKQARSQNPEEFNDLLRTSIENRISSISPIDDGVIKPNAFNQALFGKDSGASLKAALGDDQIFTGMKKLANALDVQFNRNRISKNAMETVVKGSKIPTGKFTLLNTAFEGIYDAIVNNPMAQKKFVEFVFTDAGKDALRQIAKETSQKAQQQLINDLLVKAASLGVAKETNQPENKQDYDPSI